MIIQGGRILEDDLVASPLKRKERGREGERMKRKESNCHFYQRARQRDRKICMHTSTIVEDPNPTHNPHSRPHPYLGEF